jgi:formylglycine-generating enzyme required for sulfatase activity
MSNFNSADDRHLLSQEQDKGTPFSFTTVTVDSYGKIVKKQELIAYEKIISLPGDVPLAMIYIPAGEFLMGATHDEAEAFENEYPQQRVKIATPFYIGKYAVTQEQYQAVMGMNPSTFQGKKRPAESMTWDAAKVFCQKLSTFTGTACRLPYDAEWEYACRAGTTTPFYFGETITTELANYNGDYPYAQAAQGRYRLETTEVGHFPPNAFGLYDMHGNVSEWCEDAWDNALDDDFLSPNDRLLRGGSWDCHACYCRSAYRAFNAGAFFMTGLRVVSDYIARTA